MPQLGKDPLELAGSVFHPADIKLPPNDIRIAGKNNDLNLPSRFLNRMDNGSHQGLVANIGRPGIYDIVHVPQDDSVFCFPPMIVT